jgi:hypothetical protein
LALSLLAGLLILAGPQRGWADDDHDHHAGDFVFDVVDGQLVIEGDLSELSNRLLMPNPGYPLFPDAPKFIGDLGFDVHDPDLFQSILLEQLSISDGLTGIHENTGTPAFGPSPDYPGMYLLEGDFHQHFEFGANEPGVYDFLFKATATLNDGSILTMDRIAVRFTAVPEPGCIAFLAAGSLLGLGFVARRRFSR